MDPDPGSTFHFSRMCPPYSMIVDSTQSDKLCLGSACVAAYSRYRNILCPPDINEITFLARVADNFFRLLVRESYPGRRGISVCAMCIGRDNQYLDQWEVREIA
jgi:hypothetical protein